MCLLDQPGDPWLQALVSGGTSGVHTVTRIAQYYVYHVSLMSACVWETQ